MYMVTLSCQGGIEKTDTFDSMGAARVVAEEYAKDNPAHTVNVWALTHTVAAKTEFDWQEHARALQSAKV